MLYHSSPKHNIKVLTPRPSTHGTPYVYAIDNPVTSLLFGVKHDDFDFCISTDDSGRPIIAECYPNALETVFSGKSCSLYELPDDGFMHGMTGWDAELVCENEVKVLNEISVEDVLSRLIDEERCGRLEIQRYSEAREPEIIAHVTDRLERFSVNVPDFIKHDPRFRRYTAIVRDSIQSLAL